MSSKSDPTKSELFNLSPIDLPDQTELILNAKYQYLQGILSRISRSDRIIHLTQIASSSAEKYRDINDAFLYGILANDTNLSHECFQILHSIMQDQWELFCSQARYFTYSKFAEMKSEPKSRLLWLVDKLAALQARGTEFLILGLLRQIRGGDYSSDNTVLVQKLYQLFINNRTWFYQQSQLVPFSIYSFLRIIAGNGIDLGLRKELSSFCSTVLQEKYKECSVIGRDLVRILQDVSRMSEFSNIWKFLYQKSSDNEIESSNLFKLLQVPTPKKFLSNRLTPDMETNLIFILDHVKYGGNHHRRYYEWFSNEYLKVSDPENILVDIIRYLIVAYHPPNSVIASSSVQRWQIITWFLRQFKSNYSTANAKLALFYDWLFYDVSVDNIMNVEPAILIMTKSSTVNPKITCTMIEFLYILKRDYFPFISDIIEKNIDKTMFDILSKRVISNLESILLSDQIGEDIKRQTKELFPCYSGLICIKSPPTNNDVQVEDGQLIEILHVLDCSINDPKANTSELMKNFVIGIGTWDEKTFEQVENVLLQLISVKFNNFQSSALKHWAISFKAAFNDPQIDKDVIDRAIERISLLPLTEFNIETFLVSSSSSSMEDSKSSMDLELSNKTMSISKSTSIISTLDDSDILMLSGVEDQIRNSKLSNPKLFYTKCFEQFYLDLSESPNIIELIGAILDDTDPNQLLCLKSQLLLSMKNPLIPNWSNLTKFLSITMEWDGYCQIFLWDILLITIKQSNDPFSLFKELLQNIKLEDLNDQSEILNGLINLSISLYPKPVTSTSVPNNLNEYFHWLLLLLEEGHGNLGILHVLTFYWRSNSRFFLQSLVRLDDSESSSSAITTSGPDRRLSNQAKLNHYQIKNTLSSFSKFISSLEDNSPAKKSLLSCIETTIALMSK